MIKFTELHIIQFGKIQDRHISFTDGLNVIYGENESGKSTLQLFIKTMLYGLPNQKKQTGVLRDRDRAIPWNEKQAMGVLSLRTVEREIEIHRTFGKTAAGDKLEVTDKNTGEHIRTLEVDGVGEMLLGVNAEVFEKTVWIRQGGVAFSGNSAELTSRLMNICETGDENVSMEGARERLARSALKQKAKDNRNNPGIIDTLSRRKTELLSQKQEAESIDRERKNIKDRLESLRADATQTEARLKEGEEYLVASKAKEKCERIEKLKTFKDKIKEINENKDWLRGKDFSEETISDMERLEGNIDSLDKEINIRQEKLNASNTVIDEKVSSASLIIGAVLATLGLLTAFLNIALGVILIIIGAAITGVFVYNKNKSKKKTSSLDEERHNLEKEISNLIKEKENLFESLNKLFSENNVNATEEYKKLYFEYKNNSEKIKTYTDAYNVILGNDDFESLVAERGELEKVLEKTFGKSFTEYDIISLRERKNSIAQEILNLENKLLYEYSDKIYLSDLVSELLETEEELEKAQRVYEATLLASDVLENAYTAIKTDFTPMVNNKVNEVLLKLTLGTHDSARVSDTFKMTLGESGSPKEAEYFSAGTYTQIYFALRMGISELVLGDDTALFLDDLFTLYDDSRAKAAMEYLREISNKRQIICFTCHKRDVEYAKAEDTAIILD